ncbi:MAG: Crp/Fnr family transcriptional regulator [Bacteroidales bacterium]
MLDEIKSFKNYLKQVSAIDEVSFEEALKYLQVENIAKGEYLSQEGSVCSKIAFIYKGLFRIFNLKDGNEINTCFCKENSITSSFGSFIKQVPATESIQAIEYSVVVTLTSGSLEKLQDEFAIWRTIRLLLTEKECFRLSERADSLSFDSALEKYKNLLRYQPEIIQRVSIQHIASYIGVSRETLSRIRSQIR